MRVVVRDATVTVAALGAALAAAGPAAAGAWGTIPVDPARTVGGAFTAPGTQAWRVTLERGRYYALRAELASVGVAARVVVRRPDGRKVLDFWISDPIAEGEVGGRELRAPVAGTYTVAVTLPLSCGEHACLGDGRTGGYLLGVGRDCPDGPVTPCAIAVGGTLHGLWTNYPFDGDWFRVRLEAGVTYRLSVPSPTDEVYASVTDARALAVVGGIALPGRPLAFTVPVGGTYYLVAAGDEVPSSYGLTIAVAP